jgi:hypothetical protein
VDLLRALDIAKQARDLVRDTRLAATAPAWLDDEETFLRHFGAPYEAYETIVHHMSPEQTTVLDATLSVNPEAAVLWVLSMQVTEVGE